MLATSASTHVRHQQWLSIAHTGAGQRENTGRGRGDLLLGGWERKPSASHMPASLRSLGRRRVLAPAQVTVTSCLPATVSPLCIHACMHVREQLCCTCDSRVASLGGGGGKEGVHTSVQGGAAISLHTSRGLDICKYCSSSLQGQQVLTVFCKVGFKYRGIGK